MRVDFAGGADSRRGPPRELVLRSSFGERDELAGNVALFAVVALPNAFWLRMQADSGKAESEQQSLHGCSL